MKTQTSSGTSQEQTFYACGAPGQQAVVHLDYDVVDRLSKEVFRGYGVMPRRGVEMGGVLLGRVDSSRDGWVVHIEDFEPVACSHAEGPTYVLSDEETTQLSHVAAGWSMNAGRGAYAVGLYRSHVREGLEPTECDDAVLARCFPEPWAAMLLVKPFATRASIGAFFFREAGGQLQRVRSAHEFPFRSRDLGGEHEPRGRAGGSRAEDSRAEDPMAEDSRKAESRASPEPGKGEAPSMSSRSDSREQATTDLLSLGLPVAATEEASGKKIRSGWVWIPLSFIFLLLGVVLGFQIALSVRSQTLAAGPDPYVLHLTAEPSGDDLHVKWDRNAGPIQSATRGALLIEEGSHHRVVKLDAGQLHNGSVIYRRPSGDVRFRLEVQARERNTVSESLEFKITPSR